MIRLEQVSLSAGSFRLKDATLEVPAGGYGLVIGPTGSGKTTLLEAIAGHTRLGSGRILLGGRDVTQVAPEDRGIGFVYQAYHLFPHRSVRENIAYGVRGPETAVTARVEELAQLLGIGPLLERGVRGLSGGEQQRVALARALAPRPAILLLDEPFAAVDPVLRRVLRRELQQLREREGVTTLHVTHDVEDALRLGDVVAVLADGRIQQSGPPTEVFRYPNSPFVAHFLGAGTVLQGRLVRAGPSGGDPPRFNARFESGGITLDVVADREGDAHAVLRPEDILVSRAPFPDYPRNRFGVRLLRAELQGPVTHLYLDLQGETVMASVTTATAEALALRSGEEAHIAVKATAIHLI